MDMLKLFILPKVILIPTEIQPLNDNGYKLDIWVSNVRILVSRLIGIGARRFCADINKAASNKVIAK